MQGGCFIVVRRATIVTLNKGIECVLSVRSLFVRFIIAEFVERSITAIALLRFCFLTRGRLTTSTHTQSASVVSPWPCDRSDFKSWSFWTDDKVFETSKNFLINMSKMPFADTSLCFPVFDFCIVCMLRSALRHHSELHLRQLDQRCPNCWTLACMMSPAHCSCQKRKRYAINQRYLWNLLTPHHMACKSKMALCPNLCNSDGTDNRSSTSWSTHVEQKC